MWEDVLSGMYSLGDVKIRETDSTTGYEQDGIRMVVCLVNWHNVVNGSRFWWSRRSEGMDDWMIFLWVGETVVHYVISFH